MIFQRQIGGKVDLAQQVELHYRENFKTLVKRISYRSKTVWNAEDIVQEAYLRALKYSGSYLEGSTFNNWFSRILSNTLKDFMRAERDYAGMDEVEEEDELVEDDSLPNNIRLSLRKAIHDLPQDEKEIIELNLVYGYDLRQIVQIVDVKYSRVHQVIQKFKKELKEKYNL